MGFELVQRVDRRGEDREQVVREIAFVLGDEVEELGPRAVGGRVLRGQLLDEPFAVGAQVQRAAAALLLGLVQQVADADAELGEDFARLGLVSFGGLLVEVARHEDQHPDQRNDGQRGEPHAQRDVEAVSAGGFRSGHERFLRAGTDRGDQR